MSAADRSPTGEIRAYAMAAWLDLQTYLIEATGAGRPVPCLADPDPFTSDDRFERREAAAACRPCPVLVECARFARANGESAHVWGGVDLTRTSRGSRATRAALLEAVAE